MRTANGHWHEENPRQSGIDGNHMYSIYMAVTKHGSFFAPSVCKLGHVGKDPVLYQRRHMLHVAY